MSETKSIAAERLMERVRALLTKAEDPAASPAEAEAFTAKATALMAKYGIDEALVADRGEVRESVTHVRIPMAAPYAREKAGLLAAVARNFRCRFIQHIYGRTVEAATLFGFPSDLERAQVLYTSLLLQATRDVLRVPVPYYEQPAPFRRTWLVGFAAAVSVRLRAAEEQAKAEAEARRADGATTSRSVALVLADRTTVVDAAVQEAYPNLRKGRARKLTGNGLHQGYAAGKRADIGSTKVGASSRRGIGGAR